MLSVRLYGQDKIIITATDNDFTYVVGVKISLKPNLDGWSVCHFFKGALTYEGLRLLGAKPKDATRGAIAFAFLYEIFFDGLGNPVLGMEPDPLGADIADIFCDTIGIYATRILHVILKIENATLTCKTNGIQLSVAL